MDFSLRAELSSLASETDRRRAQFDNLDGIPLSFMDNKYYLKFQSFRHRKLNLVGDFIASMTDKEALETFYQIRTQ